MRLFMSTPASISAEPGYRVPSLSPSEKLSVLLICDDHRGHANTVLDHIAALTAHSAHDVRVFNPCGMKGSRYLDLSEFDVIVLHYSLVIISDHYLSPSFREQIRRFRGLKIQFLQDEYRWVDAITAMMRHLGIHVLFTLLRSGSIPLIYDDARLPGVHIITTLAGYVPNNLIDRDVLPLEHRPIEIGYRGRMLSFWLGRLAQEKVWIAQGVLARASQYNLRCDIAWKEEDRIYGQPWIDFISSCRATLGTESGASITDFDGTLEKRTKAYLAEFPSASFEEVTRDVVGSYDGKVPVTAISPRVFEAAALRTALILFPGEYSGVIKPWEHYIPLRKDFGNMHHVVAKLRDLPFLRAMTERTYRDLVISGRYSQQALADAFDQVLITYGKRISQRRKMCYYLASLERPCAMVVSTAKETVRPWLLVPQNILKGLLAVGLLMRSTTGRQVLKAFIKDASFRQAVSFGDLVRDILKLAVVGQVVAGKVSERPFEVHVDFHPERGALVLESQRLLTCKVSGTCSLSVVGREQHVKSMVWNHSAVGGTVSYVVAPFLHITVCVGDYDLHSFEGFVQLMRHAPELAWDLCGYLVNAPSGVRRAA